MCGMKRLEGVEGFSLSLCYSLPFSCFCGIIYARSYKQRKQSWQAQKLITYTINAARQKEAEKAMNEQAAAARRAYKREWAAKNPDKVKAQQERYWAKKAAQAAEQAAKPPQLPQEVQPA